MKRLIRWLTKVSGVRREIIIETRVDIANNLPLAHLRMHPKAYNVLFMLREDLTENLECSINSTGDKYKHYLVVFGDDLIINTDLQIATKAKK